MDAEGGAPPAEEVLEWPHGEVHRFAGYTTTTVGLNLEQVRTVRPLLTSWSRIDDDRELLVLRDALVALREAWAQPQATVDFPLWCEERARELSDWERVYLEVARFTRGRRTATWPELQEALSGVNSGLARVMILAACGHPGLAQSIAAEGLEHGELLTGQGRWVAWIGGRELTPGELAVPHVSLSQPLRAAIHGAWNKVLETSTKKALKAGTRAVTDGGKVLVQLARWRLGDDRLTGAALRASFGRWFAYAYHANTTYDLTEKAPYVYLYGRELAPGAPAELLAGMGQRIGQIKRPPSQWFDIPEEPRERLEELIAVVDRGFGLRQALETRRTARGVELVLTAARHPPPRRSGADPGPQQGPGRRQRRRPQRLPNS